jgi:iron complex transport system permease protein
MKDHLAMGKKQLSDIATVTWNRRNHFYTPVVLAMLLLVGAIISLSLGRYGVPAIQVVRILLNRVIPLHKTWTDVMETVVVNIRLPRIVMACLVGCALSATGASYQAVFQNPMASPDILSASAGAAFGAALAILSGFSTFGITILAFLFSLLSVGLVIIVARFAPGLKVMNLILAGIMMGSLLSAGTSYIKLVADPSNQLPAITYWMMGSLAGAKSRDVVFIVIPLAIGLIPLILLRWQVTVLTIGDEEARTMGVNPHLLRTVVILSATLLTAASVSVSGMIGWVGLVIPHISRRIIGSKFQILLPVSMLNGALFLLIVDNVSRNLLQVEIPIGILTAFIGAPFFIYLIIKGEKVA